MQTIFNDEDIEYAIKYKVNKLNKDTYLMSPVSLIKGYEEENGFKTDTELLPYAETKQDLKNKYVADMIYNKNELEYVYNYENNDVSDEKFLAEYFFEDYKNVIILVNTEDVNGLTKIDLDFKLMAEQSSDVVYCMDEAYPAAILNETAIQELLSCKNKKDLNVVLRKYRNLIKSFKKANKKDKITKIYVSDGKVNYIETLKDVSEDVKNEINVYINTNNKDEFDSNEISYNGLRNYIKERVYGHDNEIDTFAQKIYMNYTAEKGETIESILLVGPTGTGKTETVHAACEYLDLPSYEVNASNIVPQGIKGMSIEDVIIGLFENSGKNIRKAEKGIIFLDEFDKLNDSSLDLKESVKNILLTFTAGGTFPIENEYYKFKFDSSNATKIYAGVFDRINGKIKTLGFNSILEFKEMFESDQEIRKKIIENKYFTLEELSRISTIINFNELDRKTKKKILTSSKLSEFTKKKNRYQRQFKIDLIADDSYIDAVLDTLDKDAGGMRSVNNYVKRTINEVEKSILIGDTKGCKKLILTKDTVTNPHKYDIG